MNPLLFLGANKWLAYLLTALVVLGGTAIYSYRKGVQMTDAKWVLSQAEAQKQKELEQQKLLELAELVTLDINKKDRANHDLRTKLSGQVKDVTDGRVCFANLDALRVWNQSLLGESGVSGHSPKPVDSTTGAGITDADILANQVENGSRWKECRDHLSQIIEWRKKTRGE